MMRNDKSIIKVVSDYFLSGGLSAIIFDNQYISRGFSIMHVKETQQILIFCAVFKQKCKLVNRYKVVANLFFLQATTW